MRPPRPSIPGSRRRCMRRRRWRSPILPARMPPDAAPVLFSRMPASGSSPSSAAAPQGRAGIGSCSPAGPPRPTASVCSARPGVMPASWPILLATTGAWSRPPPGSLPPAGGGCHCHSTPEAGPVAPPAGSRRRATAARSCSASRPSAGRPASATRSSCSRRPPQRPRRWCMPTPPRPSPGMPSRFVIFP